MGLSRLSVWWLRLGITVDFVRPAHPQDNGAHEQMHRVLRADIATPPAPSVAAQKRRIRAWISCYNHERPHEALGQRVPAQMYWPSSRPMPEQSPKVKYPCAWQSRRVRNRGHIKWQGRAFYRTSLCRRSDRAEKDAPGHPRSLPPSPSHWLALRARTGRNATGLHRSSSLRQSARPPLQSKRAACERAPDKRRLRRPAIWLVCSRARQATQEQNCYPCHEIKVLPMS